VASESFEATAQYVEKLIPSAEKSGVVLLIETAGAFADTGVLRDLLNRFASDSLGALWDVQYPYMDAGETPETTIKNLGAYVKHVHMKDAKKNGERIENCLVGEGELPISEIMKALSSVNYDGYVSLEWDPEWMVGVDSADVILTHFSEFMRGFGNTARAASHLYDNKTHTGKFVWKKDVLIKNTFPQVLDRMVEEFPDQYAFRYTTMDYTRTYSQFRDDVDEFARALIALGVKKGSKVTVWATNIPQWYIAFWATTKIGAVLVTVNTAYKIHEIEYLLKQSDTHTLVMVEYC
jgi:fatty-acyl-CoA synthase